MSPTVQARRSRESLGLALLPGTRLIREWQGRHHVVDIVAGRLCLRRQNPPLAVGSREKDHRHALVRAAVLRPMNIRAKILRCAVYTRKSTEEGLDQEFNSLDAQREACTAYIASQAGLGWTLVADRYDDGGISGGTMERPALQRLLQDIGERRVDVVVVYKIDRLTRSLVDFSKMVEIFDQANASFVSITQQFNTTTSMGRLTLNVLLSFAQFEREVTAERIRDKIAASKKKGMWMGGAVPLGYRVENRKLMIEDERSKNGPPPLCPLSQAEIGSSSGRRSRGDRLRGQNAKCRRKAGQTVRPRQPLSPALKPGLYRQGPTPRRDF